MSHKLCSLEFTEAALVEEIRKQNSSNLKQKLWRLTAYGKNLMEANSLIEAKVASLSIA